MFIAQSTFSRIDLPLRLHVYGCASYRSTIPLTNLLSTKQAYKHSLALTKATAAFLYAHLKKHR